MLTLLTDFLSLLGILGGALLCWFSYSVFCLRPQLGRWALATILGVLGVGSIVNSGAQFTSVLPKAPSPSWALLWVLMWALITVPWAIFSFQYSGRRTNITRRQISLLLAPVLLVPLRIAIQLSGAEAVSNTVVFVIGSLSLSYMLTLTGASCYVLIQSTLAYDHCPVQQGISLSVIPVAPLFTWALNNPSFDLPAVAMVGIADIGILLVVGGFAAARYRYHLFTATPAIGILGGDSLITETDDMMFVVDYKDRVVTSNRKAAKTLDIKKGDIRGSPIKEILGYGVSELSDTDTISLTTTDSTQQYDSQVSAVTDPYANQLGVVISLRDVSDREFRQQQLAVLNRVLRHNIRNRVDVAKSHAEALPNDTNGHRAAIISSVDDIVSLSNQARQIDQYIADRNTSESISIPTVINEVLRVINTNDLSISIDMPDSAVVTTNHHALMAATESALSNAVDYASSTVSITVTAVEMGYQIEISDDGPGIPAAELDSLDTGTETQLQHTTGLGLWQIKWAVQTIGGNVTFETHSGTTVTFTIPDETTGE